MDSSKAITRETQKVARLELRLARQRYKARKAETRFKIEYGGLVVKAGMSEHPKAVILGALLSAYESLKTEEGLKTLWQSRGEAAFMGFNKEGEGAQG